MAATRDATGAEQTVKSLRARIYCTALQASLVKTARRRRALCAAVSHGEVFWGCYYFCVTTAFLPVLALAVSTVQQHPVCAAVLWGGGAGGPCAGSSRRCLFNSRCWKPFFRRLRIGPALCSSSFSGSRSRGSSSTDRDTVQRMATRPWRPVRREPTSEARRRQGCSICCLRPVRHHQRRPPFARRRSGAPRHGPCSSRLLGQDLARAQAPHPTPACPT